jgi:hypothetical protein
MLDLYSALAAYRTQGQLAAQGREGEQMSYGKCPDCGEYVTLEEYNAARYTNLGDGGPCFRCTGERLKKLATVTRERDEQTAKLYKYMELTADRISRILAERDEAMAACATYAILSSCADEAANKSHKISDPREVLKNLNRIVSGNNPGQPLLDRLERAEAVVADAITAYNRWGGIDSEASTTERLAADLQLVQDVEKIKQAREALEAGK